MTKQSFLIKIENKLAHRHPECFYRPTRFRVDKIVLTAELFSLFLDMAESIMSENLTTNGNFHTYICDHIDEKSELKHPLRITHQCFVIDQFKQKIEELRKE